MKKPWLNIRQNINIYYSQITILTVLLFSLVFAGCNSNNIEVESFTAETNIETSEEIYIDENVMDMYYAVLKGEADFINYSSLWGDIDPKETNINELLYDGQEKYPMAPTKVACVDFDQDGAEEVVILTNIIDEETGDSTEIEYFVFHYYKGSVYGYEHVYRGMNSLDTNGHYISSGGAWDNQLLEISFDGEIEVETILAESTTIYDETRCTDSTKDVWFFIGDEEVDESSYTAVSYTHLRRRRCPTSVRCARSQH